jgi:hypothetical protein
MSQSFIKNKTGLKKAGCRIRTQVEYATVSIRYIIDFLATNVLAAPGS